MSRNLRLQVMLNAVDRVTGPLKRMREGAGKTGQAMRETRDQLRDLQRTQSDLTSYRKARVAERKNMRSMRDAQSRAHEYTQALNRQREAHGVNESALKSSRQEYRRLAREMANTDRPNRKLIEALERTRTRLGENQRAFDESSRVLTQYRNRVRNTDERIKQLTQNKATLIERARGLKTRLDEAGISTDNLGRSARELRTREERLNTAFAQQKRELAEVTRRQERLNSVRNRYQGQRAALGSMAGAGGSMLGTGSIAGYAGVRFLGAGATFDTNMARVQSLARLDKEDAELAAIRTQARELGRSTMFTSSQVAEGQAFLAMAGFNPQDLRASMPGLLSMARAGDMDLDTTADIGSNILTAMKLPAEEMTRVADVLTAAFTRSNTSISTLGETMKYAAPGAAQFGVALETTTAMAAKLGDAGIQGSMGGTSIRRMLSRLANPNSNAQAALDSLGITVSDDFGNMRDVPSVLKEIYDASRHLGDIERGSLWKNIAGETGSNAMGILVDQAGRGDLQALIDELLISKGEAEKVSLVQADNWGGDWDQLKSAWADVGIEAFEQLNTWLRKTTQNITNIVRGIGNWMRENPRLTQALGKIVIVGTALMTILGGMSLALAGFLGPIVLLRFLLAQVGIKFALLSKVLGGMKALIAPVVAAFKWLAIAIMFTPIGWIVAGIAALAAAGVALYKYWQPVKAFFIGFWQGLRESMGPVAEEMRAAFSAVLDIFTPFAPLLTGISNTVKNLWGWFTQLIAPVELTAEQFEGAASVGRRFGAALGGMLRFVASLNRRMTEFHSSVLQAVGAALVAVVEILSSWSPGAIIRDVFVDGIRQLLIDLPQSFSELGSSIMDGIMSGMDAKLQALREKVTGVGDYITGIFRRDQEIHSPSRVWARLGGHTMQGLANGIEGESDSPLKQVRTLATSLRNAAGGLILSAGISTGAAANIDTSSVQIDARPPLQSHTSGGAGNVTINLGGIVVNAAPGMDEQALARLVTQQVERALREAERRTAAASRRNLYDND